MFPNVPVRICPHCRASMLLGLEKYCADCADELAADDRRARRKEAFESFYAQLHPACGICGQPQTVLVPAGGEDAYAVCATCDRPGDDTPESLGIDHWPDGCLGHDDREHDWGNWTTTAGIKYRYCRRCGNEEFS